MIGVLIRIVNGYAEQEGFGPDLIYSQVKAVEIEVACFFKLP